MKSYLSDIGVDMTIDVMETVAWGNYVRAGKHDALSYSAWPMSGESNTENWGLGWYWARIWVE